MLGEEWIKPAVHVNTSCRVGYILKIKVRKRIDQAELGMHPDIRWYKVQTDQNNVVTDIEADNCLRKSTL